MLVEIGAGAIGGLLIAVGVSFAQDAFDCEPGGRVGMIIALGTIAAGGLYFLGRLTSVWE